MSKPLLIVNPEASAVSGERAAKVAEILGADVLETERPGHATELAAARMPTRSSSSAGTVSSTRC